MIDYRNYPSNWKTEIRPRILARAGDKCEQCGVRNGAIIRRSLANQERYLRWIRDTNAWIDFDGNVHHLNPSLSALHPKEILVVLTIHHIGVDYPDGTKGDETNKMDCRDENLIALCQYHHLEAERKLREARKPLVQISMFDVIGATS